MSKLHHKPGAEYRRWKRVRRLVLDAANWRCADCGAYGNQVDHIRPLKFGGARFDRDNLQVLCGGRDGCHARKTRAESRSLPDPPRRRRLAHLRGRAALIFFCHCG